MNNFKKNLLISTKITICLSAYLAGGCLIHYIAKPYGHLWLLSLIPYVAISCALIITWGEKENSKTK